MEVESKLGLLAIFNLDRTVKNFWSKSATTFPHCLYRHKHFVRTSHMMLHAHAGLKLCLPSKIVSLSCHLSRAMSFDPHRTPPLLFSTLPSSISSTLSGSCSTSFQPRACADPHFLGGDGFTEFERRTGYEPKMVVDIFNPIVTEQEYAHSTEDHKHYSTGEGQIPEIEDKFSLPCNQSLLSSTHDSMKSLATPQEADLDDEQIRALLASPRYLPEREASAERSQIYHSDREGLMSSSSKSLNFFSTGKPVAWLSHQKRLGQDDCSEREHPADVLRGNESVFSDANPANVENLFLKEIEITCPLKRDLN